MIRLSIKQKIKAYSAALNEVKKHNDLAICDSLLDYLFDSCKYPWEIPPSWELHKTVFSELLKYKPGKLNDLKWWAYNDSGKKIRIKVLKEIIKELKEALK